MGHDGTLTPSQPQDRFARTYHDGLRQGGRDEGIAIRRANSLKREDEESAPQIAARARPALVPESNVLSAIEATAMRYGSHPGLRKAGLSVSDWLVLFRANIEVESAYRQNAVSHAGAIGLGQLMPDTARDLGVDPSDPFQNLDGSARYLAMMLQAFGDPRLALAAYNAGPDAVRKYSGVPPYTETQNHIARVLRVATRLQGSNS